MHETEFVVSKFQKTMSSLEQVENRMLDLEKQLRISETTALNKINAVNKKLDVDVPDMIEAVKKEQKVWKDKFKKMKAHITDQETVQKRSAEFVSKKCTENFEKQH